MARSDYILNLIKAWKMDDSIFFRKTVEAIIFEERSKKHKLLANKLENELKNGSNKLRNYLKPMNNGVENLFYEILPQKSINDLILSKETKMLVNDIIEEQNRRELLRSYNMEPRHRILLTGPPGNGKTSLAEALAESLMVPLILVRYEGIIGSFLGETAGKLKKLFDYIRTRQCVLFFDEFDTIGKERGDTHETGEIKRVVSSLLLQIDGVPSHTIVIAATNHSELLDKAVWRRFQVKIKLPKPTNNQIAQWFIKFVKSLEQDTNISDEYIVKHLSGLNFSEVEDFCNDVKRKFILNLPSEDIDSVIRNRVKQMEIGNSPKTK